MGLKRLVVRTKKSLSGLYSFSNDQDSSPAETASPSKTTTPERVSRGLEEFGLSPASDCSPVKDSPSRRKRLLGSLRSMSSLRSLRSQHSNSKPNDEAPSQPESPCTPVQTMPPLALNFEVSPPDQPIFDPAMRRSASSSISVTHSTPIPVPPSARQMVRDLHSTPPGVPSFMIGTLPDSPAPLQKRSVQESILSNAMSDVPATSPVHYVEHIAETLPTPMPGTNLSLEEIAAPDILVSSPTATTLGQDVEPGYFDLPVTGKETTAECGNSVVATDGSNVSVDVDVVASTAPTPKAVAEEPLQPVPEELNRLRADETTGDSTNGTNGARALSSASTSTDSGNYGDGLTYIVWDDPEIASKDECQVRSRRSTWGRHTGLYDGTGYGDGTAPATPRVSTSDNTEATTESTELTEPEEEAPKTSTTDATAEPIKGPAEQEEITVDDKEALQDIICAYAGSMLYHDDAGYAGYSGDPRTEETDASPEADVELSIRVMNRSLGG